MIDISNFLSYFIIIVIKQVKCIRKILKKIKMSGLISSFLIFAKQQENTCNASVELKQP